MTNFFRLKTEGKKYKMIWFRKFVYMYVNSNMITAETTSGMGG
jgi:hypothetical protein